MTKNRINKKKTNVYSIIRSTAIIALIEANALFGKMNPLIASVKAVIHSGLLLTVIFGVLVHYL